MRSAWCLTVVLLFSLGLAGPGQAAPDPLVISDFETETDFSRWLPAGMINNCPDPCTHTPATLTRVTEHPTSGSYACRIDAPGPPAAGVGMTLVEYITNDWSDYSSLYLDVYNPHPFPLVLDVALGDVTYGDAWEYISTSHHLLALGLNHVKVDLRELHRDFAAGEVDRTQIGYLALFLPHVPGDTTVYVDHLRLDTEPDDPFADAVRNIWKFDFGTPTSFRWPDFLRVTDTDTYPVDVSAKPYGWTNGTDREAVDLGGPDGLTRDCVRSPHGCCRRADTAQLDFRLDIPNGDYRVYLIARSGDNFNWPSLGWRVTAEGAVKLSASMDSATFYTTDYFYRGMDED